MAFGAHSSFAEIFLYNHSNSPLPSKIFSHLLIKQRSWQCGVSDVVASAFHSEGPAEDHKNPLGPVFGEKHKIICRRMLKTIILSAMEWELQKTHRTPVVVASLCSGPFPSSFSPY